MNKKVIALAAAAMMTVSAGSVFAAPVDLDGSVSVHYRTNTYEGGTDKSDNKLTFKLNANTSVGKNVDLFARLAAQKVSSVNGTYLQDFLAVNDNRENVSIDRFGFIIKDGNSTYKIGRQDIALGANETLYSSGGYLGTNTSADGIVINTKSGEVALKGVIARENSYNSDKNKVYGLQASYKPSDAVTLGATLARYNREDGSNNYWAVNTGYDFSKKANVMGEYAKSDANTDNQAYNIAFNYAFDDKVCAYIINHKTENNATMSNNDVNGGMQWTAFDQGQKGFYYGVDYKVSKVSTFSLFYKNNKYLANDKTNTSLRTTLTYKF